MAIVTVRLCECSDHCVGSCHVAIMCAVLSLLVQRLVNGISSLSQHTMVQVGYTPWFGVYNSYTTLVCSIYFYHPSTQNVMLVILDGGHLVSNSMQH